MMHKYLSMVPFRVSMKIASFLLLPLPLWGSDWPQYLADQARSGASQEKIRLPFHLHWVYQPPKEPCSAWDEPGKEVSRLDFDYAHQPVIWQGKVFFCSTSDDSIRALDLKDGKLLWRRTTGGPMRFAPAVGEGRVYAVSDDGRMYCFDAEAGELQWSFRGGSREDWLLGNRRMVSRWPMRSGVVLDEGVVYAAAGMWPTEGVFLCALDAKTGELLWRNDSSGIQYVELPHPGACGFSGVAPQGYMALYDETLLVATGRACPAAFRKDTGEFLYCWPHRSWNDAKRGGCWLTTGQGLYFNTTREPRGTSPAYVGEADPFPGDGMVAYDLVSNEPAFELHGKHRVVVDGDKLYAVGSGEAALYDLARLKEGDEVETARIWSSPIHRVYSLIVAGDLLFVGGKGMVSALKTDTGERVWYRIQDLAGAVYGLAVAQGKLIASTEQGTLVCLGQQWQSARHQTDTPDWTFQVTQEEMDWGGDVLERAGAREGYALLVGEARPGRIASLALQSQIHVIQAAATLEEAKQTREALFGTGLYGDSIAAVNLSREGISSLPPYFADLVIVGKGAPLEGATSLYERVKPCGGLLLFGGDVSAPFCKEWLRSVSLNPSDKVLGRGRDAKLVRGALPDSGEWRRQWADSGKTGIGSEKRLRMPLQLLWFGGPGPDRMMDRHYGTTAPLSVAGRVFVTGEHAVIAFDAYNGRELWVRSLRGVGRRGAVWTSGNMVADEELLFAAIGSACFRIKQVDGSLLPGFSLPEEKVPSPVSWEYIDVVGDILIGSCKAGDGHWRLFALNKVDGEVRWIFQAQDRIPATGVACADESVVLLDIQSPDEQAKRRGELNKPQRRLLCLDLREGTLRWAKEQVPHLPNDRVQVARGVVSLYANVAYDQKTGEELWRRPVRPVRPPVVLGDWIIAQPHAYGLRDGEPRLTRDELTGETRPWRFVRSYGCGSVNGCEDMLLFRSGVSGFYDFDADGTTTFGGVRAGCSINMIPANGLAILPETSSGCTCTYNFQTSLSLVPVEEPTAHPWFVLEGSASSKATESLQVNLGAPGDKRVEDGSCWLSFPRPILRGAVPVGIQVKGEGQLYIGQDQRQWKGRKRPWLYGSGLKLPNEIEIDFIRFRPVVATETASSWTIDGKLEPGIDDREDGSCRMKLSFDNGLQNDAWFAFQYDKDALYMAFEVSKRGDAKGWKTELQGKDARVWEDDSWEVYMTDASAERSMHLGVSASGARFDGLWDHCVYEPLRGLDRSWEGDWKSAVSVFPEKWILEIRVPFDLLSRLGLDRGSLRMNVLGTGPGELGSPDYLSVNGDAFYGQWHGFIRPPETGDYRFILEADEYAVLKIDGKAVATHEGRGEIGQTEGRIHLTGGERKKMEVSYEEGKGSATIRLLWERPKGTETIVPASAFFTPEGTPGGLTATFRNRWYEDPILSRVDPVIDFHWQEVDLRKVPKVELRPRWGGRPQRCEHWIPVQWGPMEMKDRYILRLHFASLSETTPVSCPLAVSLEGEELKRTISLDQALQPQVEVFKGIAPGQDALLQLTVKGSQDVSECDKILLCGLQVEKE